jgi:NADH-quinone oxidoreductase subunit M
MNWLSILVFSPLLGMLVISFIPKLERKLLSVVGILATIPALIISLILFFQYRSGAHLEKFD